jgi:hypothetical protein
VIFDALVCLEPGLETLEPRRRRKAAYRQGSEGETSLRGDRASSSDELPVPASSVSELTDVIFQLVLARDTVESIPGLPGVGIECVCA